MSATRITRSRRPAPTGAGRLVSHALLAIISLIVAVFAHGGACDLDNPDSPSATGPQRRSRRATLVTIG